MKRICKCTFLLAALGASTFASCKGGEGGSPAVRATATAPTVSAARPADASRALAASPDFARELDRRRTAWIQQQASQEENKMTPERVRKMEMSRLELTSVSQEAAAANMGLGEGDQAKLRQALIDFRDATLFRIEHPDARVDARGPDVQPYQLRQRKILGDARYSEFSRLEQQEREKLIAGRRAFRKSAAAPTASQPSQ
jgi:hypothetical protein